MICGTFCQVWLFWNILMWKTLDLEAAGWFYYLLHKLLCVSVTLSCIGLCGAAGFRKHLKALCCKKGTYTSNPSLPHWCLQGAIPFCCLWHFVIYFFISLFGPAAGVHRIRAHGEDLSSSARLSSAAADRVLFHSLQWKRVHRDLGAGIVCALRCLITFDWTPY